MNSEDPIRDRMQLDLQKNIRSVEEDQLVDQVGASVNFDIFDDNARIQIHTQNSIYRLWVITAKEYLVAAVGGQHLPKPTICYVNGCTQSGSVIISHQLVVGMHLELQILKVDNDDHPPRILTTSKIKKILF